MKKTKCLLFALIAILCCTCIASAQSDLRSQNIEPLRWHRYTYNINSAYPYLKELPDWSKIPVLSEWINRDDDDAGTDVAYSQLVALSRADFGHPLRPHAGGLPKETLDYYRTERTHAWDRWWKLVGQNYAELLHTRGRQNWEAWKLIVRDEAVPMPEYKVAIPDEWTFRTSYRAGDYGGMQSESVTLHRSKEKATLVRALRTSTDGALAWERWEPLTIEQADNFAFAMAYAIDNPWLLKSTNGNNKLGRLEGRNLTTYYPGFRYEFADAEGNIWWNDDPQTWRGRGEDFMTAALGSVCRLLWRTYPDTSVPNAVLPQGGKWIAAKSLDSEVLQLVAEDLVPRGEIIDTLRNSQRISDGLETLAEFGTLAQMSAISELEAELPKRVKKVKAILEKDPNKGFLESRAERLLSDAAKAKAAIHMRNK